MFDLLEKKNSEKPQREDAYTPPPVGPRVDIKVL